jgi:hypothetical protein
MLYYFLEYFLIFSHTSKTGLYRTSTFYASARGEWEVFYARATHRASTDGTGFG